MTSAYSSLHHFGTIRSHLCILKYAPGLGALKLQADG